MFIVAQSGSLQICTTLGNVPAATVPILDTVPVRVTGVFITEVLTDPLAAVRSAEGGGDTVTVVHAPQLLLSFDSAIAPVLSAHVRTYHVPALAGV